MRTLTLPTPFPVGPINCYLIEGDDLTLIDSGPQDAATLTALREQLAARGQSLGDIRRVVVTHAHVDHFGLAAQIVAESGAQVLSHTRNRWWLTDHENEWERRYDFYRATLASSGAPRDLTDKVVRGMRKMTDYAASIPSDHFSPLEDGDAMTLGDDSWQVVFAPGHASGLICLYEAKSMSLISSDHLLRDITSNPVLEPPMRGEVERPRALANYLASMEKTARLSPPPRIALPAHGDPIHDIRALVDGRIAFHRSRLSHIEQQLDCCAATAYELCQILFPDLGAFDLFLGLSEVIGHLDILELEGRVRREEENGLTRYIPVNKSSPASR